MKDKNKKLIGRTIKNSRMEKRFTQHELSEKVGISRNYLSDLENGRYAPSSEKLLLISQFLDIDLNMLISKILKED